MPFPVEAEEDLGDPLLATRLCYRRIALVTLEQRHDLRFPRRYRVRIVPGDPALRGRGRDRGGLIWKRLRRGGRRCRGARLLALRGWDLLWRGLACNVRVGGGLDLGRRLFDRLRRDLFFDFLLFLETLDRLVGRGVGHHLLGSGGISVCGAAGATAIGANSITIAAAGSAGSISSRQVTIPAAMAQCANTMTAPQITHRRRSARSSAIMAFSPAQQAQPSGIRPRARGS